MKRQICCFILALLIVSLVGCTSKKDTIMFVQESADLPNMQCASYEVNIGNNVGGATVVAELWENGTYTESMPLTINNNTKKISCSLLIEGYGTENSAKGINVQIDTDEVSGSVLTYFEIPQNVSGYLFEAYEDKETFEVCAEDEVLLCAIAFDTGNGIRTVDCNSLIEYSERIKEYSCILVIRATFTAEQINPVEDEPASN